MAKRNRSDQRVKAAEPQQRPLCLNIGAGDRPLDGWVNIDHKTGQEAYPLAYADNSVDEIRASHILEHFGQTEAVDALSEWVRVLKLGARIRIGVPDVKKLSRAFLSSETFDEAEAMTHAQLFGGQMDSDDFHKASYTAARLAKLMQACGLIRIGHWADDVPDCSSLPVSLNLEGYKPGIRKPYRMSMVMSVPRLAFMDNMFSAFAACRPHGIELVKHTGAFWHQCLTRGLEQRIEAGDEYIFTTDYDTVFGADDVHALIQYMERCDADCIFGMQAKREHGAMMACIRGADGKARTDVAINEFSRELTKVDSGHFGLAIFKPSAFADVAKPWFRDEPGPDGSWNDGRTDSDIGFWKRWKEAGKTLYQANRVRLGHLELVTAWPGKTLTADFQYVTDYHKNGRPYSWL